MNPEAEQPQAKTESKRRAGVPVWRTGKPDAFLAGSVEVARSAIEGITAASDIGEHLAAKSEGDRLVTHLFESRLPGYLGWQWYAVLTRNSRSKVVTVNELGLLPSEDSILAPEWVPWAERVRPEDAQETDAHEAVQEAGPATTAVDDLEAGESDAVVPGDEQPVAGEPDDEQPGDEEPEDEAPQNEAHGAAEPDGGEHERNSEAD
jgi:hypothetical protein